MVVYFEIINTLTLFEQFKTILFSDNQYFDV